MFGFKNKNAQDVDIDNEPDFPAYEPEIKPATEKLKEAMQSPSKLYDLFILTIEQNQDLSKRVSELETSFSERLRSLEERLGNTWKSDMTVEHGLSYLHERVMTLESANHPSMPTDEKLQREFYEGLATGNDPIGRMAQDWLHSNPVGATKETSMPTIDSCRVGKSFANADYIKSMNIDLSFAIKALKHCLNHNSYGSCIIVTDKKPDQDSLRLAIYLLENQQTALENSKHNNNNNNDNGKK